MATDPSIILGFGQLNDPVRLAQIREASFQSQREQQQMQAQNALKQLMSAPGAYDQQGRVSPNALRQIMAVDPGTGMELQKQNREIDMDQLNQQLKQAEVHAANDENARSRLDFISGAAGSALDAYDSTKKSGGSEQAAVDAAMRARNDVLRDNGGILNEDDVHRLTSVPFAADAYRVVASRNKDWVSRSEKARDEARADRTEAREDRKLADDERQQEYERNKPEPFYSGSMVYDPKSRTFFDPSERMSGTYTGGLTPRSRNGGDNSDEVVDNKMAFIAGKIGVDIDTPLKPEQLKAFRDAYIQTEGAKGNNVGNLKTPDGRGFQQFATRADGVAAINRQINTDFGRGQTTIRQLIEGIPQSGGLHGAGGMSAAAIDLAAREGLAHGGVVPAGFARNKAAQSAIENRMAEIAKGEGKTAGDYVAQGASTKADSASLAQLQKMSDAIETYENTTLKNARAMMQAAIAAGGPQTFRSWRQAVLSGRRQFNDPSVAKLDLAIQTAMTEYARVMSGGAMSTAQLNEGARREAMELANRGDSVAVLRGLVDQMTIDMNNRRTSTQDQIKAIKARLSGKGESPGAPPDDIAAIMQKYGAGG